MFLVVALKGILAFFAVEERVVVCDAREGFLESALFLFGAMVAKLYLLQSEHIEMSLFEKIGLLVGVTHHSPLLVF